MPGRHTKHVFCLVSFLAAFLIVSGCDSSLTEGLEDQSQRDVTSAQVIDKRSSAKVPGKYIVVFDGGVANVRAQAQGLVAAHGGDLGFTYTHAIKGFSASLPSQAVEALRRNPQIDYIEPDRRMHAIDSQANATWGLDRTDQHDLPLDDTYTFNASGAGVNAYIIDTGINMGHNDFADRASHGYDFVDNDGNVADCNGHGTHVAGTVGGTTWGVAKGVSLVGVRVLDCEGNGTTSGVIAGIDWVTANAVQPAVANMSLGGGASDALDEAVRNSISSGVQYAVAAGNGNFIGREADACNYSPARVTEAMTIGATDDSDTKASFSNYGDCVDWFAPGVSITSAWVGSSDATNTISGTSMAAPHVAGVAALYLEGNSGASPQQVRDAIYSAATKSIVTDSRTTNNHLLYGLAFGDGGGDDGGDGGDTNTAPSVDFSYAATDLAVDFTDQSSDSDGSVATWSWDFGDGATSTAQNPSHTYSSEGTYTVTLSVTDDDGASATTTQDVSVTSSGDGGSEVTLSANGYKERGRHTIDLNWSGPSSASVDVYRDGSVITTTANDGAYTDATSNRGKGSYTYQVCEAGTTTCSNEATVAF